MKIKMLTQYMCIIQIHTSDSTSVADLSSGPGLYFDSSTVSILFTTMRSSLGRPALEIVFIYLTMNKEDR